MISPFILPPPPDAQAAAAEVIAKVHDYMGLHPESELHRQGKMFGVLVYDVTSNDQSPGASSRQTGGAASAEKGYNLSPITNDQSYLAAFSAMLDGSYHHEGFVPPVYEAVQPPVGTSREESQRLQRLLFANYRFTNLQGETSNLLEIFANEKPILSPEEYFSKSRIENHQSHFPSSFRRRRMLCPQVAELRSLAWHEADRSGRVLGRSPFAHRSATGRYVLRSLFRPMQTHLKMDIRCRVE